jgi:1-aminocyclopropane-1-carboxylate deaminase/D-cysteine desulfhydrase-like pyridoxal-dependent ACC family enzyme
VGVKAAPPRFPLAVLPTPLVRASRLEATLGAGPLLIKRDDLAGFGVAGNKTRPLEYLVGAARDQGAEVLVTGGGPGSNFCAAAAMAAAAAGLDCELVVWGDPTGAPNIALAEAAGARVLPTGGSDRAAVDVLVAARAAELTRAGRQAYAVPRGGSTALGAVGFADAAAELARQLDDRFGAAPSAIVLPVGSGGSCAGLLAGLAACGLDVPVVGVSVSRPLAEIRDRVLTLAAECAALLGGPPPRPGQLDMVDARGTGFGRVTALEEGRARLALRTEGLLLDATYGAEAFSVAVERLRDRPAGPVVWWHTGGVVPATEWVNTGSARVVGAMSKGAS